MNNHLSFSSYLGKQVQIQKRLQKIEEIASMKHQEMLRKKGLLGPEMVTIYYGEDEKAQIQALKDKYGQDYEPKIRIINFSRCRPNI
jgi:hypothetical protein